MAKRDNSVQVLANASGIGEWKFIRDGKQIACVKLAAASRKNDRYAFGGITISNMSEEFDVVFTAKMIKFRRFDRRATKKTADRTKERMKKGGGR